MSRRDGQMGVAVAGEREGVPVHALCPIHRVGQVSYASLPCDAETFDRPDAMGEETRIRLVSILWDRLAAEVAWTSRSVQPQPSENGEPPAVLEVHATFRRTASVPARTPDDPPPADLEVHATPLRVDHDALGKPLLFVGGRRGPAISFSEGGGRIWAALCADGSEVGIDVAEAADFQGDYPRHRVFHAEELEHATTWAGGDLATASALLWSIKEAVVKALGCAFHWVDPLQINVDRWGTEDEAVEETRDEAGDLGHDFSVRLSEKALLRFPAVGGHSLRVHSFPIAKAWLSIAVLDSPISRQWGDPE